MYHASFGHNVAKVKMVTFGLLNAVQSTTYSSSLMCYFNFDHTVIKRASTASLRMALQYQRDVTVQGVVHVATAGHDVQRSIHGSPQENWGQFAENFPNPISLIGCLQPKCTASCWAWGQSSTAFHGRDGPANSERSGL
jgi:hypothetical protein